jgi:hypothetical protein
MQTTHRTRTALAATTAAALMLGSAGAATAAPKGPKGPKGPKATVSAPPSAVTLKSIAIKGHRFIDLAKVTPTSALALRATVRDAQGVVPSTATVDVTLGVFSRKVNGTQVAGTDSTVTQLALTTTKARKSKRYAGSAVLATVWTADQIAALKSALKPGDKAYACIATADLAGVDGEKKSVKVQKRLGERGRAVRDCVKVIDSTPAAG